MNLITGIRSKWHQLTIDPFEPAPSLEDRMAQLRINQSAVRPWRPASINEALGVPAIFRAVSLIASTVGSLSVEGFRNGARMAEAPQLIKRPNPRQTPRDFYRDSAYYLASRGECWWWVAMRGSDNSALALVVVPPWEVTVDANPADRLRPKVSWLGRVMPNDDMRQITFLPDDSCTRGVGPLQICRAAISVTVEAQEWAANFYASGGIPSIFVKTLGEMSETEAAAFKAQWISGPANTPKIGDSNIAEVTELGVHVAASQMLEARDYQNGDACRLFGIPGALMEFAQSGTSLTYQNVADVWRQFQEGCLTPYYLVPIEQAMGDLLSRSTIARFSIEGLLRADIKTRYDVYKAGIDAQIFGPEYAQMQEGIVAGGLEYQPVPFSPPAAIPARLPINLSDEWRCSGCGRKIAEAQGQGTRIQCSRCKVVNVA